MFLFLYIILADQILSSTEYSMQSSSNYDFMVIKTNPNKTENQIYLKFKDQSLCISNVKINQTNNNFLIFLRVIYLRNLRNFLILISFTFLSVMKMEI